MYYYGKDGGIYNTYGEQRAADTRYIQNQNIIHAIRGEQLEQTQDEIELELISYLLQGIFWVLGLGDKLAGFFVTSFLISLLIYLYTSNLIVFSIGWISAIIWCIYQISKLNNKTSKENIDLKEPNFTMENTNVNLENIDLNVDRPTLKRIYSDIFVYLYNHKTKIFTYEIADKLGFTKEEYNTILEDLQNRNIMYKDVVLIDFEDYKNLI